MSAEELARQAADRVREAVSDAEGRAKEIVAEAEGRAEEIVAAAEREAAEIREKADADAAAVAAAIKEAAGGLSEGLEPPPELEVVPELKPSPAQRLAAPPADEQSARLNAMKMALDGASREQIVAWLDEEIPEPTREQIASDVLERAAR